MQKRKNKTKAQIAEELKRIEDIKKQKKLAETTLLPVFTKYDLTIYQAGQVLEVFKEVTLGKMNQYWTNRSYAELGMAAELTKDGEVKDKDAYSEIIESLKEVSVSEVMKLFEVFTRVIEMYGHKQVMQVKLTELPLEEILGVK